MTMLTKTVKAQAQCSILGISKPFWRHRASLGPPGAALSASPPGGASWWRRRANKLVTEDQPAAGSYVATVAYG